jgi:aminopeptidase YwaD
LGGIEVKNIQDYMKGLSKFKKGDNTTVTVKRGTEDKKLDVSF